MKMTKRSGSNTDPCGMPDVRERPFNLKGGGGGGGGLCFFSKKKYSDSQCC